MFQSLFSSQTLPSFVYLLDANDNNERTNERRLCRTKNLKNQTHKNLTLEKKVHHSLPLPHPHQNPRQTLIAFGICQQEQPRRLEERQRPPQHAVHYSQQELHFIIQLIHLITALVATSEIDMMIGPRLVTQRSARRVAAADLHLMDSFRAYQAHCRGNWANLSIRLWVIVEEVAAVVVVVVVLATSSIRARWWKTRIVEASACSVRTRETHRRRHPLKTLGINIQYRELAVNQQCRTCHHQHRHKRHPMVKSDGMSKY